MAALIKQLLTPKQRYSPLPFSTTTSADTDPDSRPSTSSLPPYTEKPNQPNESPTTMIPTPQSPQSHSQSQSQSRTQILSDITLGLSDGLTVPFALTAGLSTLNSPRIILLAGLAELVAGSISMGLGGYLASLGEQTSYTSTLSHLRTLLPSPRSMQSKLSSSLSELDLPLSIQRDIIAHITHQPPEAQLSFLSRITGLQEPSSARPYISALTIGAGYFLGGFIPLFPYLVISDVGDAFWCSCAVMCITLFAFGALKHGLLDLGDDASRRMEYSKEGEGEEEEELWMERGDGEESWIRRGEGEGEDENGKKSEDRNAEKWKRIRECAVEGARMVLLGGLAALVSMVVVRGLEAKHD